MVVRTFPQPSDNLSCDDSLVLTEGSRNVMCYVGYLYLPCSFNTIFFVSFVLKILRRGSFINVRLKIFLSVALNAQFSIYFGFSEDNITIIFLNISITHKVTSSNYANFYCTFEKLIYRITPQKTN